MSPVPGVPAFLGLRGAAASSRFAGLAAALLTGLAAAAEPAPEPTVALPPFLVEAQVKGPPWRHGEIADFEVLSRCRDATTRRVVEAHHQLHELLGAVLPPELRWHASRPRGLILYDEDLLPASSQEVVRQLLSESGRAPGNPAPAPGIRGRGLAVPDPRASFLPNLRLWDRDGMIIFMIVRRDDFEAERLSLTFDYIRFLVTQRVPALPAWFVAGFLALFQQATFDGGELVFPALEALPVPAGAEAAARVPPLEQIFLPRLDPQGDAAAQRRRWQALAALVVRWGLDADRNAHRAGLWRLAARVAVEGYSAALFTECLGLDPEAARAKLTAYADSATRRPARFSAPRRTRLPGFPLADASELQIARLKGDWERLEVPYVRQRFPALAPKYLEQARRTLRRAYDRDLRDPRLLEVMGLCESDAGEAAAAREFLEAAAALGPLRPRAAVELARLRLDAFRQGPWAGARLDAPQLGSVLEPLFAARSAAPPLVETYELIGEAWAAAAARPTRGHLAALEEGIRLFPRQTSLALRAAELNLAQGYRAEAGELLELASRTAEDPRDQERVLALRARWASAAEAASPR